MKQTEFNNFDDMFNGDTLFNEPIGHWDTSKVTDMSWMFNGTKSFNQDLSNWDVSNVIDMTWVFFGATSFNQDLSNWNVSSVTDMRAMFDGATSWKYQMKDGNNDVYACKFKNKTAFFIDKWWGDYNQMREHVTEDVINHLANMIIDDYGITPELIGVAHQLNRLTDEEAIKAIMELRGDELIIALKSFEDVSLFQSEFDNNQRFRESVIHLDLFNYSII